LITSRLEHFILRGNGKAKETSSIFSQTSVYQATLTLSLFAQNPALQVYKHCPFCIKQKRAQCYSKGGALNLRNEQLRRISLWICPRPL